MKTIGIIAGTKVDTKFGLNYYGRFSKVIGVPISETPQEQTKLQALNKHQLTLKVQEAINYIVGKGAESIVVYCNSLSGAIDLRSLREKNKQKIITPLDVYEHISQRYNVFGLVAANCQSTANIERVILSKNKDAIVIGIGNLNIVNDIENGLTSDNIIKKHRLVELCEIITNSGAELIILGCTHYTFFYDSLKKLTKINILEPSEEMGKNL